MRSLAHGLIHRGVLPFEIFQERFQAAGKQLPNMKGARFKVVFSRSGVEQTWSNEKGTLHNCRALSFPAAVASGNASLAPCPS
jgi:hypothetical protein